MSGTGFTLKREPSKRKIKHTQKVKHILAESMIKAFRHAVQDVREMHDQVQLSINTNQTVPQVKAEFLHWIYLNRQMKDLYLDLEAYTSQDEAAQYLAELRELRDPFELMFTAVEQYCEEEMQIVEVPGDSPGEVAFELQPRVDPQQDDAKSDGSGGEPVKKEPTDEEMHSPPLTHPEVDDKEQLDLRKLKQEIAAMEKETSRLEDELRRSMIKLSAPIKREEITPPVSNSTPLPGSAGNTDDSPSPPPEQDDRTPSPVNPDGPAAPSNLEQTMLGTLAKLTENIERSRAAELLPRLEPEVFSGDPLKYASWWTSFQVAVAENTRTAPARLLYLLKYTSGDAKESIEWFRSILHQPDAYDRACNVLKTTFGNRTVVAEAFKDRLNKWPAIRDQDPRGLQKFGNYLMQCNAAMGTLKFLSNIDSQEEIQKLAAKLPRALQIRWNRRADTLVCGKNDTLDCYPAVEENEYPDFSTFSAYVLNEARIMARITPLTAGNANLSGGNGPSNQPGHRPTGGHRPRHHHSFDTQARPRRAAGAGGPRSEQRPANPRTPSCVFCKGEHYLSKCTKFLENTPEFKRTYASSRGLCFGCLSKSHLIGDCKWKNPDLLASVPEKAVSMATSVPFTDDEMGEYYTMILPVWVTVGGREENSMLTYALLDSQSSTSFMSEELRDRLQCDSMSVELELTTLGSTRVIRSNKVLDVAVTGLDRRGEILHLRACYTKALIPGDRSGIPDPRVVNKKLHLAEVAAQLPERMPEIGIDLLLGNDCQGCMRPEEVVCIKEDPMYAIRTPLGWTVVGPICSSAPTRIQCLNTDCREITQRELRAVFDNGFEEPEEPERMLSAQDLKFLKLMKEGMEIVDGRIQLPLPLKEDIGELPDSRPDALRVLFAMKRKMIRDPEFGRGFAAFMNDLVQTKAEPVPYPDAILRCKTWYWPCHGVTNPRKPGKVRGVFNGSHEVEGICLNDLLLQGPDLTNNLVGVLCRFRLKRKPLLCDVEGMFLQVLIAPRFRDLTRFVWFQDGDVNKPVRDYRMKVHLFGAKSSPSCANYAFRATADMFEEKYGKEAADFVRRNFYVDDGLGGSDTNEQTIRLATNARNLCSETGFNLHKFGSTEKEVLQQIPVELVAKSIQNVELSSDDLPMEKALGLDVSLEKDSLEYKVTLLDKPNTRRGCLSGLSSVYDPLGLVGPAILPGRQQLQSMCVQKLEWDQPLEDDQKTQWRKWYQGLMALHELTIPRCVKRTIGDDITLRHLHTFCDASTSGLGAACYLHLRDESGADEVNLMYAKSKVAPTKVTTVPRLELQACVLGVKIARFLKSELDLDGLVLFFWTDSMVVLIYIMSESKRFYMYVMNRADYIQKNSEVGNWRHIGTDHNPADLASRGCTAEELVHSSLWWEGPPEIVTRYREAITVPEVDPSDPEVRKPAKVLVLKADEPQLLATVMKRVSKWEIARGCTACILRYGQIRLGQQREEAYNRSRADVLLVKAAQKECYPEYFRGVLPMRGPLNDLAPFLDADGILRVGGRNTRAEAPYEVRHPVVLPPRSRCTQLLVEHYHRLNGHMRVPATLNALRARGYWVIRGRSTVRHYLSACVECKRRNGKGIGQVMAELPENRVTPTPPFTAAAVDLFGPYKVTVRRSSAKRWMCLFVCMVSRAIHLEIVHSLSTSSYLCAHRRFTSRRGPVKSIQCDRGTNFVGADTEVAKAERGIDHQQVECELAMKGCAYVRHTHNSPKASHMGGAWERLIRTTRAALDYVLANPPSQLDDELLLTLAAEAEAVVNARPLGYVDGTDPESPLPLSPMMLLTLKPEVALELPGKRSSQEAYMHQRWRYVQYLMKVFWDRWRQEVLPLSNPRKKWQQERDDCKKGTVVLVMDEQTPRPLWPLGIVDEVIYSHDGKIRRVMVRMRGKVYERPVTKLIELMSPPEQRSIPIEEP